MCTLKFKKSIHKLKQPALLTYNDLVEKLISYECPIFLYTLGLWKHNVFPAHFYLCVDDLDITYLHKNIHITFYVHNKQSIRYSVLLA